MKQTGSLARVLLLGVVLSGTLVCAQDMPAGLRAFFRGPMGLTDSQMTAISRGTAVARALPSETPAEIVVFGAVFVNAAPEEYRKLALDMDRLRKLPNYLAIRRFGSPPALTDLEGFSLEAEDIRDLLRAGKGPDIHQEGVGEAAVVRPNQARILHFAVQVQRDTLGRHGDQRKCGRKPGEFTRY